MAVDTELEPTAGVVIGQVDVAAAGGTATLDLNLEASRYKLYCSLFDHEPTTVR